MNFLYYTYEILILYVPFLCAKLILSDFFFNFQADISDK